VHGSRIDEHQNGEIPKHHPQQFAGWVLCVDHCASLTAVKNPVQIVLEGKPITSDISVAQLSFVVFQTEKTDQGCQTDRPFRVWRRMINEVTKSTVRPQLPLMEVFECGI
jgi:hypothetical protein